jgi:hypothetical protein
MAYRLIVSWLVSLLAMNLPADSLLADSLPAEGLLAESTGQGSTG